MRVNFGIDHPLQRDGNSQSQREVPAQAPETAPVDGRQVPDLLYFWLRLSRVLLHWNLDGRVRDWMVFFDKSVPFKLAEIYQEQPEKWWAGYQEYRNRADQGGGDALELLLSYLFNAFFQHQNWHQILQHDSTEVSRTVRNLSVTNLHFVLETFVGIYNTLYQRFGVKVNPQSSIFFNINARQEVWQFENDDWSYLDPLLNGKIGNRETILPHVLPRLDSIAEVLYKSRIAIRDAYGNSDPDWESLIATDAEHQPHIGLMLAFLRIFRIVQGDFNALTERHLQFFYRQVLQLTEQEAVPDAAHLSLQLAKHVDTYKIEQGTSFKDGKDLNKAEIVFSATEETVLNQASVADIRTLFFPMPPGPLNDICPPEVAPAKQIQLNIPFLKKNLTKDFSPFGNEHGDKGRMGFVLGGPVLQMTEGNRIIKLQLVFDTDAANLPSEKDFKDFLSCEITTEKNWLALSIDSAIPTPQGSKTLVEIKFTVGPDKDSIAPLKEVKLNPYGSEYPLLRTQINLDAPGYSNFYGKLKSNTLSKISLLTEVTGLSKKVILSNDEGPINVTKVFQPFGTRAQHRFYVQHPDLENKSVSLLNLRLTFDAGSTRDQLVEVYRAYSGPTDFDRTTVDLDYWMVNAALEEKMPALKTGQLLFSGNDNAQSNTLQLLANPLTFIKGDSIGIKIDGDPFVHNHFPLILARQAEAARKLGSNSITVEPLAWYKKTDGGGFETGESLSVPLNAVNYSVPFPGVPHNPTVLGFSLEYHANQSIHKIIQLLPFDDSTETVKIADKANSTKSDIPSTVTSTLLPFIKDEGHLYLGLKNAPIQGNVALLFQVNEYTGNSDLKLPALEWSVLKADNSWRVLQKDIDFSDDTEGLAQAGIIRFELPPEAARAGFSVLPEGHTWLRARAMTHSAAFDRLLGLHIQAVKTVFTPEPNNDLDRLNQALPDGSLKKIVVDTANIAKIEQPYATFGGKAPERPENFYRRIAERLRHKGRAVNIWDYEYLVLEAFPQIYKVKCLTHTLGLPGMKYDFEFLNGKVTLVVIPNVRNLPLSQREKPKASQNLLGDIQRFLKDRISPFVCLQVLNPRYETINVNFEVKFRPGKDDAYYKKVLEEEIKTFLSPWRADEPAEIQFGGEVYRSSLIDFCDSREYVDFVQNFQMIGKQVNGSKPDEYRVASLTARSVLTAGDISIRTF
ncbi:baseplate J/gp47 family protein [Haliscomenobacter sp.]|uniref:baseplate J/gp47 family protein n=1 Tax=Haliscomenobacter sp. TaxID=2717303 RepID=UPI003BA9BB4B